MHVQINFIIQLYLNHMNRIENKNEAEALVKDNFEAAHLRFVLDILFKSSFCFFELLIW
ncbi:hypothetical protein YC2023_015231 [Brassica napus]